MNQLGKMSILGTLLMLIFVSSDDLLYSKELRMSQEGPEPKSVVQEWQKAPKIPEGWKEIDRKQAKITNKNNLDVFVLMTDGANDQIVWFEKMNNFWKMIVLENVPSEGHKKYGVDIRNLNLAIVNNELLYGEKEGEPISFFRWDAKEKIFVRYIQY